MEKVFYFKWENIFLILFSRIKNYINFGGSNDFFFQNEQYEIELNSSDYERIKIDFDSIIEILNYSKLYVMFNVSTLMLLSFPLDRVGTVQIQQLHH